MKKFTLVELLVVISIIGVLAGILLPVVSGSRQRTMVLKAKTDITNLTSAINKYESAYGKLPIAMDSGSVLPGYFGTDDDNSTDHGKRGRISNIGYDIIVQSLSGIEMDDETIVGNDDDTVKDRGVSFVSFLYSTNYKAINPRKIQFLDVPNDFAETGFLDPWGNRYVIYFDYEDSSISNDQYDGLEIGGEDVDYAAYDKKIEQPALELGVVDSSYLADTKSYPTVINSYVAVYCIGPNGTDEGGLSNDIYEGADDINSWSSL